MSVLNSAGQTIDPTTGKYVETTHSEAEVELPRTLEDILPPPIEDRSKPRAATAYFGEDAEIATRTRNTWWDSHHLTGEYRPTGGVLKFPVNWSTRNKKANSSRAAYRKTYGTDDWAVTMPSRAAINSFCQANPGKAVDVPISGTINGDAFSGWVRVHKGPHGQWAATTLGNVQNKETLAAAEIVTATLENRRTEPPITSIQVVKARHHARMARMGPSLYPTHKNNGVAKVGFDAKNNIIIAQLSNGTHQAFPGDEKKYTTLLSSRWPLKFIRNTQALNGEAPISQCPKCHRVYSSQETHDCILGYSTSPT